MPKKKLNEGLFDALMNTIFAYAAKKEIQNDPEFRQKLAKHTAELQKISQEAEKAMRDAENAMDQAAKAVGGKDYVPFSKFAKDFQKRKK